MEQDYQSFGGTIFDLKLQVMLNSATISSYLSTPTLRTVRLVGLPVIKVSFTIRAMRCPSSQVNVAIPFAFFKKFPSIRVTNKLTLGFFFIGMAHCQDTGTHFGSHTQAGKIGTFKRIGAKPSVWNSYNGFFRIYIP